MDSQYFTYNGVKSQDMGVYAVRINSGMYTVPFLSEQEIVSEQPFGVDTPYVFGTQRRPLKFPLILGNGTNKFWTFDKRREVARWLNCGKVAPLVFTDMPDKYYFCTYTSGIDLTTNGVQDGYLQIQMQNISPYTYSGVYTVNYDFSTITTTTNFTFDNLGDIDLYPQLMTIQKYGAGDISIVNNSDGGRIFSFTGLIDQEILTIQNDIRSIDTSLANTFRYNNFNGNYLKLVYGRNYLTVTGAGRINIQYRNIFNG